MGELPLLVGGSASSSWVLEFWDWVDEGDFEELAVLVVPLLTSNPVGKVL